MNETLMSSFPFYPEEGAFSKFLRKRKVALKCPLIDVIGTNGKSSIAHRLSCIYEEGGYKVGLISASTIPSPYSSIKLNGKIIEKEDFEAIFTANRADFEKFKLCVIEIIIAIGIIYLSDQDVDLVILDYDGGQYLECLHLEDFNHILTIVSNVELDDTEVHGTTLSSIAYSFASVFNEGAPVLVGKVEENEEGIIRDEARELGCEFIKAHPYYSPHLAEGKFHFDFPPYKDLVLNEIASSQIRNVSLAIDAVSLLNEFPISEDAIRKGLLREGLPCRSEKIGNIIFDSADNPAAVEAIIPSYRTFSSGGPLHVLFASSLGKNIAVMLPLLDNNAETLTLTTIPDESYRKEEDYFLYTADHPFVSDPMEAIKQIEEAHPNESILVIGGSNFAFYVRERIAHE